MSVCDSEISVDLSIKRFESRVVGLSRMNSQGSAVQSTGVVEIKIDERVIDFLFYFVLACYS